MQPKKSMTFRLDSARADRLTALADKRLDPYAPNATQIVERGIDLAIAEMEMKRRVAALPPPPAPLPLPPFVGPRGDNTH